MGADESVVFGSSYEALARVLSSHLDDSLLAQFRAHGVDLKKPNVAYPYATWVTSLELAMRVRWPQLPHDEATYALGSALFESFGQTLLGKGLMPLLRILGPRRGLERMNRNLRSSNNYSQTRLTARGPTEYELWINLVGFPHYFRGLLETGLAHCGAKSPTVSVLAHEAGPGGTFGPATFLVKWLER